MFQIKRFACENLTAGCVTDRSDPSFSFTVESDRQGARLAGAELRVNGWKSDAPDQLAQPYGGAALKPFTAYTAELTAVDDAGEKAAAKVTFETGRMGTPWQAKWITDAAYTFTEKGASPVPMLFRRRFALDKKAVSARIYATALGVYELELNGKKVGDQYLAPGFTSYKHRLQYQTYDVTGMLGEENALSVTVAGGWAVGSFVMTRVNRVHGDRQALLLELRLTYADGSTQVIGTDENWQVTEDGPCRMADLYDGETWDATVDPEQISWRQAAEEKLSISPKIDAATGAPVRAHEEMKPISCTPRPEGLVYDFGQNFAGVVKLRLKNAKRGQTVTVRHAEILNPDGSLNTAFLRTAKATATYICTDGEQTYSPRLSYMGFRYICVSGVGEGDVEVSALALYSDMDVIGSFSCSDERLNRLQSNIVWSSKSNLMDIPTDCPQRDERMGWTGDIAVFAPTACFNFDMSRFLDKWLEDVRAEQLPGGGIPNTVPVNGYGFPATMPSMAIDWWGDACVLVPWAEYRARGDKRVLERNYPTMKRYVKACLFWAGLFSFGKNKYIWNTPSVLHFGDWVAPDVPKMSQWQGRAKWTATASLRNTSRLTAQVAELLGKTGEAAYYRDISDKVADAYCSVFTDGKGKLLEEFQTAYVLPLYMEMFPAPVKDAAVENLVRLVEKNDYCIGTGFPGTPYILFALCDNGRPDVAYKMLMNAKCPSWLYEVLSGGTTIWERWDGLDENGVCPISADGTGGMISYNHYASGAVGDFLYRRVAGIEPVEPGYKTFQVKPILGGGITSAQAEVETPYGAAAAAWQLRDGTFTLSVTVPVGSRCRVVLPDGTEENCESGTYTYSRPVG